MQVFAEVRPFLHVLFECPEFCRMGCKAGHAREIFNAPLGAVIIDHFECQLAWVSRMNLRFRKNFKHPKTMGLAKVIANYF